jgi:putative ABC transport system permease protein
MFRRVPLAWANLTHNPRRFAVSLAGVGFAVVLMFVQFGFRNALFDSTAGLINHLNADLVVVSHLSYTLAMPEPFSHRRLYQARAVDGVEVVRPLYMELGLLHNLDTHTRRSIRTLGIEADSDTLDLIKSADTRQLALGDRALYDKDSRPSFGIKAAPDGRYPGQFLSGEPVELSGTFRLGADFSAEGTLVMGSTAFAQRFRRLPGGQVSFNRVDVGLVSVTKGQDPHAVQDRLRSALPGDVDVLTRDEFAQREKDFWADNTPIGFTFGFGMAMGFIVGIVICYQILSTDVADHLPEYATLRAIGYPPRYLSQVVLQQAVLLGAVGFLPGLGVSWLVYRLLESQTGLPMLLTPGRMALIFGLTVVMCVLSGLLALRKAQTADPAEVF